MGIFTTKEFYIVESDLVLWNQTVQMTSIKLAVLYFLVICSFALAMRNRTQVSVNLYGLFLIRDVAKPINHFIPPPVVFQKNLLKCLLGLPLKDSDGGFEKRLIATVERFLGFR